MNKNDFFKYKMNKITNLWDDDICQLRIKKLLRTKLYGCWNSLDEIINKVDLLVKDNKKDEEIYKILKNLFHEKIKKSREYILKCKNDHFDGRAQSRIEDISTFISNQSINRYLDIGCGDGSITSMIGSYLRKYCNENIEINGIDVYDRRKYDFPHLKFKLYNGIQIPYEDRSFDMITVFMVLHHIDDIYAFLNEILRVLRKGGILIIREHDVDSIQMKYIIDIQHELYNKVWNKKDNDDMPVTNYKSKDDWDFLIEDIGLKKISDNGESNSFIVDFYDRKKHVNIPTIVNPYQVFYSKYVKTY